MRQDQNRKHYALTSAEGDLIRRIDEIVFQYNQQFAFIDENGQTKYAFPDNYYVSVKAEISKKRFNNKRISLKKAEDIAARVFSSKWYTIMLAGDIASSDNKLLYYLVTSESDGKSILIDEDSPYYKLANSSSVYSSTVTDETYLKERQALGLSPEHLFLYSTEYMALSIIANLKDIGKEPTDISGYWSIKNDFVFLLPAMVNKRSMSEAVKGTNFDRDRMIITFNNISISYKPNKEGELVFNSPNCVKLLDKINNEMVLTGYKSRKIRIPLKDILHERGLTSIDKLRLQLKKDADILDRFAFTGELGNGDYSKVAITQGDSDIKNGYLCININEKFFDMAKNSNFYALSNPKLQKLPAKGYSYIFARAFENHNRSCQTTAPANKNKLSVETLLKYTSYPKYEDLKDKGQAGQKIIDPFLKSLNDLEDYGLLTYTFYKAGEMPLTPEEEERKYTDYHFFSTLIVKVTWAEEPDYTKLLDAKKDHIKKKPGKKRGAKA